MVDCVYVGHMGDSLRLVNETGSGGPGEMRRRKPCIGQNKVPRKPRINAQGARRYRHKRIRKSRRLGMPLNIKYTLIIFVEQNIVRENTGGMAGGITGEITRTELTTFHTVPPHRII